MVSKQDILTAAFKLFCQRGYSLSLSDIAKTVGLKTPSLYSHFSCKDEIIEQIIQTEVSHFYANLESVLETASGQSAAAGLKEIFMRSLEYFREHDRLRFWRSLPLIPNEKLKNNFGLMISEGDRITTGMLRRLFTEWTDRGEIRRDVSNGSVFLFAAMLQGVLDGMLLYPPRDGKALFAEQVFEAFFAGIRADSQ